MSITVRAFAGSLAASVSVLTLLSCAPWTEQRYEQKLATTTQPARHAVHSARLEELMNDLNTEVAKTWPQEISTQERHLAEQDRRRQFRAARHLAASLADAADQIPQAIEKVELPDADRKVFLQKVTRLRNQARQLEASAANHDLARMQQTAQSIENTCNDCHHQFRKLAGPITFGRPTR